MYVWHIENMNLKTAILQEHSKKQTQKIVSYIGGDKEKFATLMQLFFQDESLVIQRSAWVISNCCDKNPKLILPYLDVVISYLSKPNIPDAAKRNFLRVLQFTEVPEELMGKLISVCFSFFENQKEAIAIRVFSMSVLANAAIKYPDLKIELIALIELEFEQEKIKPAMASRGKKVLKILSQKKS